jgi:hypothetical protein
MTSGAIVRIKGKTGVDDAGRLLAELAEETDLEWRQQRSRDGGQLSGMGELLLTAVISGAAGKGAEMVAEGTLDRVRAVIRRWRDRKLDPPDAEVELVELPEDEPGPGPREMSVTGEAPGLT